MSDNSHIEWTDALFPVTPLVAGDTEGLNIKPMDALVPQVVVVLLGLRTAVKARERVDRCHRATPNRSPDRLHRLPMDRFAGCREKSSTTNLNAAAVHASRSEPIMATPVNVKANRVSPGMALGASFEPRFLCQQVVADGQADLCGGGFECAFLTSHGHKDTK